MLYVDSVHYEQSSDRTEYIARMKWTHHLSQKATDECDKSGMIDYINKNPGQAKTKYLRNGRWEEGEVIRVVDNRYLRTDANNIKADNLGALPRY